MSRGGKMGWAQRASPSARPARQLDGPKYGPARPFLLARFEKIK